jgi:hypothetical protein
MKHISDTFPLQWPDGWERTPQDDRRKSRYSVTPAQARKGLIASVKRLGGEASILSSNLPVGSRGATYMTALRPQDPGVAVHWVRNGKQEAMACDKWLQPWENMHAIHKAIEGLRAMERAGATQIMERAFQAFQLPKETPTGWREVLDVEPGFNPSKDYIKRITRELLRKLHPDMGGDEEAFKRVQKASAEALKELG